MRRFFQPSSSVTQGVILLTGAEAHHAAQVMRLRTGESVIVLDGRGGEHFCTAVEVGRREVALRLDRTVWHERPRWRVRLVQAITKGKSFDLILQKAVELGAGAIQPLLAERVVARPAREEFAEKREKWGQTLIEAAKQCGAFWLPEVLEPLTVSDALLGERGFDLRLVAALGDGASHPRRIFEDFFSANHERPSSISIWIGPEGDFTTEEIEQITQSGVRPTTLGVHVLRSETAALSALAILNHELTAP